MRNSFTKATPTNSVDGEIVLVVIGHPSCGKTSLICTLTTNRFLANYRGLFIDHGLKRSIVIDRKAVDVTFYEHSIVEFDPHHYTQQSQCHMFCVCVDTSQVTLRQLHEIERTVQRLKEFMPHTDIILIGTRTDLSRAMSFVEAQQFADSLQANLYIDVSAKHLVPRQTSDILHHIINVQRTHNFRQRCYDEEECEALLPRKNHLNRLLYATLYDQLAVSVSPQMKQTVNPLLVGGYLRHMCTSDAAYVVTAAIIESVSRFIVAVDARNDDDHKIAIAMHSNVSYYYNTSDWNVLMGFAASRELKRQFFVMYWCNLCAAVFHNIGWLSFSIQLCYWRSHLGCAALFFSGLETALIITAHVVLWCRARILFYTQMLNVLHVSIEALVNLPMVCLLSVYSFTTPTPLVACFYFALLTFFGFMCYKFFAIHCFFARLNHLHKTNRYRRCSLLNWCIFLLLLLCALIISVAFTALDIHQEIAAVITGIVLCVCLCCICIALPWLDFPSPFGSHMNSSHEIDAYAKKNLLQ